MYYLNKLKSYPIDLVFVSSYYDKLLFTHPKKLKLIMLLITHILLLITLVTLTMFYVVTKNKKYIFIIRSIMNYSIYFGVFFGVMYLLLRVAHI